MRIAARFVLIATLLASAPPAHAGLTVCNRTAAALRLAAGRYDGSDWRSEGWWVVPAQHCSTVIAGPLKARYYYLYASDGGAGSWDGERGFCVKQSVNFVIEGRGDCAAAGFDRKPFFEVDTGSQRDFTQTLSD